VDDFETALISKEQRAKSRERTLCSMHYAQCGALRIIIDEEEKEEKQEYWREP
jgi:hypothetical protein